MDENVDENAPARATDDANGASPSPFRRFPYAPCLLAALGLGLAMFLWGRCTGCDVVEATSLSPQRILEAGRQRYVGERIVIRVNPDAEWLPIGEPVGDVVMPALAYGPLYDRVHCSMANTFFVVGARGRFGDLSHPFAGKRTLRGTVLRVEPVVVVDWTERRDLGEAVVATLVALVCSLVFGLYLRRWLRERKAA